MSTETPNAFIGRPAEPSDAELIAVLGPTADLWTSLVCWAENDLGITGKEWKGVVVRKYGWSLRLVHKKRNIVYLVPCVGSFRVAFILGQKAMEIVRATRFPKTVAKIIATAPRYPEGTGIRLTIQKAGDLASVRKLAQIKMQN